MGLVDHSAFSLEELFVLVSFHTYEVREVAGLVTGDPQGTIPTSDGLIILAASRHFQVRVELQKNNRRGRQTGRRSST